MHTKYELYGIFPANHEAGGWVHPEMLLLAVGLARLGCTQSRGSRVFLKRITRSLNGVWRRGSTWCFLFIQL